MCSTNATRWSGMLVRYKFVGNNYIFKQICDMMCRRFLRWHRKRSRSWCSAPHFPGNYALSARNSCKKWVINLLPVCKLRAATSRIIRLHQNPQYVHMAESSSHWNIWRWHSIREWERALLWLLNALLLCKTINGSQNSLGGSKPTLNQSLSMTIAIVRSIEQCVHGEEQSDCYEVT